METKLISKFHRARCAQMAQSVMSDLNAVDPTGVFADTANCQTLWDEVSWAFQEADDSQAEEAAQSTLEWFVQAEVKNLLPEELRLHCYLLTDDASENGLPFADAAPVISAVVDHVKSKSCSRDLSDLAS